MGFVGPQQPGLLEQLGVELNERGNVARDDGELPRHEPATNVFVCGDMGRGQSLIVWAIAEGRSLRGRRRPGPDGRDVAPGADHARRGPDALSATAFVVAGANVTLGRRDAALRVLRE